MIARAIAVEGLGYGRLSIASRGLLGAVDVPEVITPPVYSPSTVIQFPKIYRKTDSVSFRAFIGGSRYVASVQSLADSVSFISFIDNIVSLHVAPKPAVSVTVKPDSVAIINAVSFTFADDYRLSTTITASSQVQFTASQYDIMGAVTDNELEEIAAWLLIM